MVAIEAEEGRRTGKESKEGGGTRYEGDDRGAYPGGEEIEGCSGREESEGDASPAWEGRDRSIDFPLRSLAASDTIRYPSCASICAIRLAIIARIPSRA